MASGRDGGGLPRRDFVLIPLLALLTLAGLSAFGEFASRQVFAEKGSESCGMASPGGYEVMRPNCTSHRKAAEGPEFTNAYNDCGYRAPEPCHMRAPGALRVALMGASTAQGMKVRYPDTFAARLSAGLSRACGRPVEFQNMGVPAEGMLEVYRRMDEALSMQPDLVMVAITPIEMRNAVDPVQLAHRDDPILPAPPPAAAGTPPAVKSLVGRLSDLAYESRMLVAAQHFLFQDDAVFAKLYMLHGDEADYLRLPFSPGWEQRMRVVDLLLDGMATKARAAGVPLMLVMAPQRIQTALLDPAGRGQGVDPFEIGRRVAGIAATHGVAFEDELPGFAGPHDPGALFYPVDGHMDADGHAVFAHTLQDHLIRDTEPFRSCAKS